MGKKSKSILPVNGVDYETLKNGAIRIARCTNPPTESCGDSKNAPDYLALVDHSLSMKDKKVYQELLDREVERFASLYRRMAAKKKSLILVLQGRDGAGKSGTAKVLHSATDYDPKNFLWVPIGPPTDDEKAHGHLWRFYAMDRMPRFGQVRVFDRSWAERGLVEPVMKIIDEETLNASYPELSTHEWLLNRQGSVIVKIWMDVTKREQKKRFETRLKEKPWKYNPTDIEARKLWDKYTARANALFHLNSPLFAPWYIISSEDKRYSRVTAMSIINDALEAALDD